ncbi:MAG: hypothetical protein HY718_04945 [Planctomycetes bacterium]|nr:hypothetical protein [Planctomycetota bacterium]
MTGGDLIDGLAAAANSSASDLETAEAVAECWRQVLRLPSIEEDDDFFQLGGSSLSLIRAIVLLNERGYDVDLDRVAAEPGLQLRQMTRHCRRAVAGAPPEDRQPPSRLFQLPFHRRSFATVDEQRNQFVALMTFLVECPDIRRLAGGLEELIRVHDALRIRSIPERGGWSMDVAPVGAYSVRYIDARTMDRATLEAEAAAILGELRELDIGLPRLVSALAVQHTESLHQILMYVHHAICDGYSCDLVREQLRGYLGEQQTPLRAPSVSYARYAAAVETYVQTPEHFQKIADYVERPEVFGAHPITIDDPTAEHTGDTVRFHPASFALPTGDQFQVHRNVELLAIGAAALATSADADWSHLGVVHHGRSWSPNALNVSGTVGCFIQQLQVFLSLPRLRRESLGYVAEEVERMKPVALDVEFLMYAPERYPNIPDRPARPRVIVQYNGDVVDEDGLSLAKAAMGTKVWSSKVVKDFSLFLSLWLDRRNRVLHHRWEYGCWQYADSTASAMADRFRDAFLQLARQTPHAGMAD